MKKKSKTVTLKQAVHEFYESVWDAPQKYTPTQVASIFDCSVKTVYSLDICKKYQKRRNIPAKVRVKRHLAKDKTGKREYTCTGVAKELGLARSTVKHCPAMQEHKNMIRRARGKKIVKYKIPKRSLSPKLEKEIATYISKNKGKLSRPQVADGVGCSKSSVSKSIAWQKRREELKIPALKIRIEKLLFDKERNRKLNKNTGKKYKREEVAYILKCNENTVSHFECWKEYRGDFERLIKRHLAKDKTGKRGFTRKEVADAAGCSETTVQHSPAWGEYREKVMALLPAGTAEERIERVLQEMLAEGVVKPDAGQVAKRAECETVTVHKSKSWNNRHMLFPPLEERIGKAHQDFYQEGILQPSIIQVAERAKCSPGAVTHSSARKQHRQRLSAKDSPVAPETDTASIVPILAPRIKKKKESADKTTFTKEEFNEYLENEPIWNGIDDVNVVNEDSLADKIGKSVAKHVTLLDTPHGVEQKVLGLAEQGFQPIEIVDLLHPDLPKTERRNKSKRYSEIINTQKKNAR